MSLTPLYFDREFIAPPPLAKYVPLWILASALALLDTAAIVGSFALTEFVLTISAVRIEPDTGSLVTVGVVTGLTTNIMLVFSGCYTKSLRRDSITAKWFFPKALLASAALIAIGTLLMKDGSESLVSVIFLSAFVSLLLTWPLGSISKDLLRARIRKGLLATSRGVLLRVATRENERSIAGSVLAALSSQGVEVLRLDWISLEDDVHRANASRIMQEACAEAIQQSAMIYLSAEYSNLKQLEEVQKLLVFLNIAVYVVMTTNPGVCLRDRDSPEPSRILLELRRSSLTGWNVRLKRALDIVVSVILIILLIPFFLLVAACIKLDSPGPILFRQSRCGQFGRKFTILKFRTMTVQEDGRNIRQAELNDCRITLLGKALRRSSIDELPQLFNVLLGDMSLVGPRPHAIAHEEFYEGVIAAYPRRRQARPGLTGWAQVSGHRGPTPQIADMAARVEHDVWYIENWSIVLDLKIILKTIVVIFDEKNAF